MQAMPQGNVYQSHTASLSVSVSEHSDGTESLKHCNTESVLALYLFIVGHGTPWQLIQVAVRVGLRLPLGKQTG